MRVSPEATMTSLLAHNDLIIRAKKANFGHILQREGGEMHGHPVSHTWHSRGDDITCCPQINNI